MPFPANFLNNPMRMGGKPKADASHVTAHETYGLRQPLGRTSVQDKRVSSDFTGQMGTASNQ